MWRELSSIINESREIDSIKLRIDDNLIDYISNQDGVSISDTPSIFVLRKVGLDTIDFNINI